MDNCLNCKKQIKRKRISTRPNKYCSSLCQVKYQNSIKIKLWLDGKFNGYRGKGGISNTIRNYLLDEVGHRCEKCGWDKINIVTNKVPLEINHIDGNWRNNSKSNLEVLCPNCHSLTSTYKSLNKGNGRPWIRGI